MRKLIAVEFISLDGVIQAPGGPEEDTSNGFTFGGWLAPYGDKSLMEALKISYGSPYDLLLGRNTYNIFANYWPGFEEANKGKPVDESTINFAKDFNACTKYVATHSPKTLNWKNSESLGDNIIQKIEDIKKSNNKNLLVVGSSNLVHTLLAHNLIDELHLYMAPVILGKGKRLFDDTSKASAFKVVRSVISETGMSLIHYVREGEVRTASIEE